MKKLTYLPVLLAAICCTVVFSCKKDYSDPPNVVTGTVNGENLSYAIFISDPPTLTATISSNAFELVAVIKKDTTLRFLNLYINNFSGVGQYYLVGENGNAPWGSASYSSGSSPITYDSQPSTSNVINITRIDATHKRVYGNFHFDGYNQYDTTQMVHVTNGNFSVDYTPGD